MTARILLVEDEARLQRILQLVLSDEGHKVKVAGDGGEAVESWQHWHPDLVITDLKMEPLDGLHVLRFGSEHHPDIPCIILTAFGTVTGAVDAMKNGAYDFLTKPVDHGQLIDLVNQALGAKVKRAESNTQLIGSSNQMAAVRQQIPMLAATDSNVLIHGESGTGKELVARAIHAASPRRNGPFLRVNCAAIPGELLESELFGHRKGAFTGAAETRDGAFLRADGGILFLDEIGDLSITLQPKILHAVEEKEITPIGGTAPISVSVKILSATNQNLESMIAENRFRRDLFYRLNTMPIELPPLRAREGDAGLLADHFLGLFSRQFDRQPPGLDPKTLGLINSYDWPGNVRELRNAIERAILVCTTDAIKPGDLPDAITGSEVQRTETVRDNPLDLALREQEHLREALIQCNWNQSQAAKALNITRSALRYRLQKYGIKQ